jgi:hypothetical protein
VADLQLTHWPTAVEAHHGAVVEAETLAGQELARATFTSAPESTLVWSTVKMDWPRPSSRPRSPRSTSTATCGSSAPGTPSDDVAAGRVGASSP